MDKPINAGEYLMRVPLWTKKKNTLEDLRVFLHELGDPQMALRTIHVAGTNGKGSVCADLAGILGTVGYHTGTFVSPHLVDIRERFLLDGRMVSEEDFQAAFLQVFEVVGRLAGRGYDHPSYFEYCFLVAMVLFAGKGVDYCILEAGLGGRLDATNSVEHPLACVITSISLDHMEYLGDTVEQIAGEKAGIIKSQVPVVYDDNEPGASLVIQAQAGRMGAPAYPVSEGEIPPAISGVPFAAPYQRMNAALAVKVLQVLAIPGVDEEACVRGLKQVRWQGRMERVGPGIYLDGAHNPGGARAFVRAVKNQAGGGGGIHLLFAVAADKDYEEMIHILCTGLPIARVWTARLDCGRALDQGEAARLFMKEGCLSVEQCADVGSALKSALRDHRGGDRLYIVGSLYLVGEIKRCLREPGIQEVHG